MKTWLLTIVPLVRNIVLKRVHDFKMRSELLGQISRNQIGVLMVDKIRHWQLHDMPFIKT